MTVVVLIGFFLMLLAPCLIAVLGGRERKEKVVLKPVVPVMAAVDDELDLPVRDPGDRRHLETAAVVDAPVEVGLAVHEEPKVYGSPQRVQRRVPDLKSIVAQAENEALVAHAMAAQANAAALAATARAAQARAQAAAEHAVEANRAAAKHAAAVREREAQAELDDDSLPEQPTWPELTVAVSPNGDSQRAA